MFLFIMPGFFLNEQENKSSGINLLTGETDANTVLNIRVTEMKDTLIVLKHMKVFQCRQRKAKTQFQGHDRGKYGCHWDRGRGLLHVLLQTWQGSLLEEKCQNWVCIKEEPERDTGDWYHHPGRCACKSWRWNAGWHAVRNKAADKGGKWISKGLRLWWR